MSYFKAKMHQIQFRMGLHPRLRWRTYRAPQVQAALKGPTSKRKGGEGIKRREGEEMEGEGTGVDPRCFFYKLDTARRYDVVTLLGIAWSVTSLSLYGLNGLPAGPYSLAYRLRFSFSSRVR